MQGAGRVYLCSSGEIVLRKGGRLPGERENAKVDEMLIYETALMAFW